MEERRTGGEPEVLTTEAAESGDCGFIFSCHVEMGRSWRMQRHDKCPAGTRHKTNQRPSLMLYLIWLKEKSGQGLQT